MLPVVFDTSVLTAAMHSRTGASFALVDSIPSQQFQIALSVALFLEWQDVLTRTEHLPPGLTANDIHGFLLFLCSHAQLQEIFFLWRPFLPDPDDDMILELAVAARCRYVVTHNVRHFAGCEKFAIEAITPGAFVKLLKETKTP